MTDTNVDDGFGQPKYTGNFSQTFRLKTPRDGERSTTLECRIIPPIKSGRETGRWCAYHGIHFGFLGRDRNNPAKRKNRPFGCIQDRDPKTRVVRVECPECSEIDKNEEAIKAGLEAGKAQGLSEDECKLQLAPRYEFKRARNVDRKWHINVMTPAGEFGTLEISHKCMQQLKHCIEENRDRLGDPMDLNKGYYLVFKRVGKGVGANGVTDTVAVSKVLVRGADGDEVEKVKFAPLSTEQRRQALQVLPDLMNDRVTRITSDQILQLIRAKGDPDVIDRIMDAALKRDDAPSSETSRSSTQTRAAPATVPAREPEPESTRPAPAAQPTPSDADVMDFNAMSDQEFIEKYGS